VIQAKYICIYATWDAFLRLGGDLGIWWSLFVFILIFTIVIGAEFKEEKEGAGALSGQGYAVI
jgi:hypothetical protein